MWNYNTPQYWYFKPQCKETLWCLAIVKQMYGTPIPISWTPPAGKNVCNVKEFGHNYNNQALYCRLKFLHGKQYPLCFVEFRLTEQDKFQEFLGIFTSRGDGRPWRKGDGDHLWGWPLGLQTLWWRGFAFDYSKGKLTLINYWCLYICTILYWDTHALSVV